MKNAEYRSKQVHTGVKQSSKQGRTMKKMAYGAWNWEPDDGYSGALTHYEGDFAFVLCDPSCYGHYEFGFMVFDESDYGAIESGEYLREIRGFKDEDEAMYMAESWAEFCI